MSVSNIPEKSPITSVKVEDLTIVIFAKKKKMSPWGVEKSSDLARKSPNSNKRWEGTDTLN